MTVTFEQGKKTHGRCIQEQAERLKAKPLATIQSWSVVEDFLSQRFVALQAGNRLKGHVLGLAHLPYTKIAYTSPILSVDLTHGLVETRNTIYRLGNISEEYESWRISAH